MRKGLILLILAAIAIPAGIATSQSIDGTFTVNGVPYQFSATGVPLPTATPTATPTPTDTPTPTATATATTTATPTVTPTPTPTATPTPPPIGPLVQATCCPQPNQTGVTSYSCAFAAAVTKGDLLEMNSYWGNAATNENGVSDVVGSVWPVGNGIETEDASGTYHNAMIGGIAGATGADTVTITFDGNGGNYPRMCLAEYTVPSGYIPVLDGVSVGSSGTVPAITSTQTSPPVTTTGVNDLILGFFSSWAGGSLNGGMGAGFSLAAYGSATDVLAEYRNVGTSGGYAATANYSGTTTNTAAYWIGEAQAYTLQPASIAANLTSPPDGTIYDDQTVQTADYTVTIMTTDALSNYQFDAQVANSLGAVVFTSPYMSPDPTLTPSQTAVSVDFSALPDDDYTVIFNLYRVSTSGGAVARRAVGEAVAGL